MRRTARLRDRDSARAPAVGGVLAEPALADSRRAEHADGAAIALRGAAQRGIERGDLALAAHEAREAARARGLDAGAVRPGPDELEALHQPAHALHAGAARRGELEVGFDQAGGVPGQAHLAGARALLHARGQPDRVTLRGVVHAQVVADRAHDHLARVEPDPDREAQPELAAQVGSEAAQLLADQERRVAGALRVILVRERRPEQRHHAVARVLVDRALEAVDGVGEQREEPVEHAVPGLGARALGQPDRVHHVDEQHGHLLALALEHAARAEDPFGQVVGRVRAGLRHAGVL